MVEDIIFFLCLFVVLDKETAIRQVDVCGVWHALSSQSASSFWDEMPDEHHEQKIWNGNPISRLFKSSPT